MSGAIVIRGMNIGIHFSTENAALARRVLQLLKSNYQVQTEVVITRSRRLKKNNRYQVHVVPAPQVSKALHELQLLSKMTNYCNTSICLRKVLLEYFGEKTTSQCNNCGNCDVNKNASWRKFLKF